MPTVSTTERTKLSHTLGRALAAAAVNQLGRDTGQAQRLRTVTPHRLFLAMVSTLGSGRVESLADLLRACNHQNGVDVASKAFYNRRARIGFATFMRGMLARLLDQLRVQTLTPEGQKAVARFTDIVIHDGSSFALKSALQIAPDAKAARTPFSLDLMARLYRFRWQIERCFKEWKSYANLHQFDTANPHIAEGLIWASLCAAVLTRFLAHAAQRVGGTAILTRRVAMCAHHILDALVAALRLGVGPRGTLRRRLTFLLANARRANPDRDRRTGRLRTGLGLAVSA